MHISTFKMPASSHGREAFSQASICLYYPYDENKLTRLFGQESFLMAMSLRLVSCPMVPATGLEASQDLHVTTIGLGMSIGMIIELYGV